MFQFSPDAWLFQLNTIQRLTETNSVAPPLKWNFCMFQLNTIQRLTETYHPTGLSRSEDLFQLNTIQRLTETFLIFSACFFSFSVPIKHYPTINWN